MIEHKPYFHLLEESFPGIQANIKRCQKLGFPWPSKPFLKEEKGEILSHVGFMDYPMLIEGTPFKAAALHAICTSSAHRSQGLASELIQEALLWAKNKYDCVVLFTEIPLFYEKFSFRSIQEHRFHLSCKHTAGTKSLLPVISQKDDALFLKIFSERAPLSSMLSVQDGGAIASFNALFATYPAFWSLHYSPSLHALISYQLEGKTLHLFDIIACKIPSLDEILDHFPTGLDTIYFYFSPDHFTDEAAAEPYLYDKGHLMVHGSWPVTKLFMIPPLSRC